MKRTLTLTGVLFALLAPAAPAHDSVCHGNARCRHDRIVIEVRYHGWVTWGQFSPAHAWRTRVGGPHSWLASYSYVNADVRCRGTARFSSHTARGIRWREQCINNLGASAAQAPKAHASRTPSVAEWDRAARRAAKRECQRRERQSVTYIMEVPVPRLTCITTGSYAPAADLAFRNLNNDVAAAFADFSLVERIGKHPGSIRYYEGTVHMHVSGYRWVARRRGRSWVRDLAPIIAVQTPIGWLRRPLGQQSGGVS